MESNAEPGPFDHFDIVGPIANREYIGRLETFFIAQTRQGIQFRGSPEERLQNFPQSASRSQTPTCFHDGRGTRCVRRCGG